ncbi:MAG: FKBP-type peptidyl-prolyl cis-trans isomerase [Butyribacter sp.]|nr:FKBP-type peptidyl-prolyl cis-trans isomerase [bacterium]MDY3854333.1 FKBP-type peptidyl-prolyl cis-trans isomerase [Butyribacter sp.]
MEKKVVFKNKVWFAAYTAVIVVCSLLVGILSGVAIESSITKRKAATEKKAEKEAIKEASGEDYDITKCVTLGKYSGREVSLAVTDEDVQLEIDNLIEENTTYEKKKKGTVKDGDMVYASFEGYVSGKKVDSTCGEDYIEIGSGEWLSGFEEAIIGMKPGETKKFKINVPEGTYGSEEIDGKTVTFRLNVKYICGDEIVPEYNDEFVEGVTEYKTTKEYNAYLKEKLASENEEEKAEYVWTDVLEDSKINEYPESLMKNAETEVLNGYYDMADLYGVSHDEIFQSFGCADEQEFKDTQLEDLAKDTVKELLVAKAIAYQEKISYSDEDYEALVKEEYENYSDMYDSQDAYEKENKDYLERTVLVNAVKEWISAKTNYTK